MHTDTEETAVSDKDWLIGVWTFACGYNIAYMCSYPAIAVFLDLHCRVNLSY